MTYRVTVPELEAVSLAAATDQTRRNLRSVWLEQCSGRTLLVATDGHRMHIVRSAVEPCDEDTQGLLVPLELVEDILAAAKGWRQGARRKYPPPPPEVEFERTIVDDTLVRFDARLFPLEAERSFRGDRKEWDGVEFPDWRFVLPRRLSRKPASLDPAYVRDTERASLALGIEPHKLEIGWNGQGPTLLAARDVFLAVIMPRRSGELSEDRLREWLRNLGTK